MSGTTTDLGSQSPTESAGDLIVHNGSDDIKIPVGTNGQVLTVDTSLDHKVKWAAAAGGSADTWKTLVPDTGDTLVASGADTLTITAPDKPGPGYLGSVVVQGYGTDTLYLYINTGFANIWGAVQDFGNTYLKFGGAPINISFLADGDKLVYDGNTFEWKNRNALGSAQFSIQEVQDGETLTIPARQQMVVTDFLLDAGATVDLIGDIVFL